MNAINLIPRPRIQARAHHRRVIAWSAGVAAYSISVAATCVVVRLGAIVPDAHFDAQMQDAMQRISAAATNSRRVQDDITKFDRQLDAAMTVGGHPDWSILLSALDDVRGGEIVLESIEIAPAKPEAASKPDAAPRPPAKEGDKAAKDRVGDKTAVRTAQAFTLRLTGFARLPGKAFGFARDLEMLGPLDNVTIANTRPARMGTLDLTGFELSALITDRVEPRTGKEAKP